MLEASTKSTCIIWLNKILVLYLIDVYISKFRYLTWFSNASIFRNAVFTSFLASFTNWSCSLSILAISVAVVLSGCIGALGTLLRPSECLLRNLLLSFSMSNSIVVCLTCLEHEMKWDQWKGMVSMQNPNGNKTSYVTGIMSGSSEIKLLLYIHEETISCINSEWKHI